MNYTGTIWRPPYEAWSALLQVTAGCTHHGCKFCTLYEDLPFKFRMSPLREIESDLQEKSILLMDSMVFGLRQLASTYGEKYLTLKFEEV